MIKRIAFWMILFACGFSYSIATAETVQFKGDRLTLKGELSKPEGNGPFSAVVLLHACQGISPSYDAWIKRLVSWNYVTLLVDSFSPRGITKDCRHPFNISRKDRIKDAYDAKSYLSGLQFVNRKKIAVMGWSYGGVTSILSVSTDSGVKDQEDSFRAGVAIYPGCHNVKGLNAPLLVLIGEKDNWTKPSRCKKMRKSLLKKKTPHELILKIYPKTHHGFDIEGMNKKIRGKVMKYNPEAAADAVSQVKDFFSKHLQ